MRKNNFLKGILVGTLCGFLAASTIAFAANIGVFDRGHCKVYLYQNDQNPEIIYYDTVLKNEKRGICHLVVEGTWDTAVRVTARPK